MLANLGIQHPIRQGLLQLPRKAHRNQWGFRGPRSFGTASSTGESILAPLATLRPQKGLDRMDPRDGVALLHAKPGDANGDVRRLAAVPHDGGRDGFGQSSKFWKWALVRRSRMDCYRPCRPRQSI